MRIRTLAIVGFAVSLAAASASSQSTIDQLTANFAADEAPQSQFVAAVPIGASEPVENMSERLVSLPATGSTVPLMGLSGVLLLGLATILAVRWMMSSRRKSARARPLPFGRGRPR